MKKKNIPTHDPQTGELNPHYEELTGKVNPIESTNNKRSIKEMTYEELCYIANIATGGNFISEISKGHKEVEAGGYGWRRRVEWVQNENPKEIKSFNEYYYFEITGEHKGESWSWQCKAVGYQGHLYPNVPYWEKGHLVNTLNPMMIVDYCREQELDIENIKR